MVNTARLLEAVEANDTAYIPKLEVHDRSYDKIPVIYMGEAFIKPDHPEEDIYMQSHRLADLPPLLPQGQDKHFKRTVTLRWMLLAWQHLTGEPLPEMTEKEYKAMTNQIKTRKAQTAKAKKSNEEDFVDGTSEARGTKSQKKRKMELDPD
ncbi:hypothetical protein LTR17_003315 [Elasticomyces elasticus]|nr:hypothetical protein LTR17_003315 [Elasticomyces elasticus]